VIIADTRSSMVAANVAATIGCAFDFDVDFDLNFLLAQRAPSGGVVAAPLNSAR
jgi:hypothetical protein